MNMRRMQQTTGTKPATMPPLPASQPAMAGQPEREAPASVGEFLVDFFYPIGSKKR